MGFPGGSDSKESACKCRRLGFNPWVRKIPWRRAWQPTPVFLPGEPHGQRSLAGYSPWGRKESDTTEQITFHFSLWCHTLNMTLWTILPLGEGVFAFFFIFAFLQHWYFWGDSECYLLKVLGPSARTTGEAPEGFSWVWVLRYLSTLHCFVYFIFFIIPNLMEFPQVLNFLLKFFTLSKHSKIVSLLFNLDCRFLVRPSLCVFFWVSMWTFQSRKSSVFWQKDFSPALRCSGFSPLGVLWERASDSVWTQASLCSCLGSVSA